MYLLPAYSSRTGHWVRVEYSYLDTYLARPVCVYIYIYIYIAVDVLCVSVRV